MFGNLLLFFKYNSKLKNGNNFIRKGIIYISNLDSYHNNAYIFVKFVPCKLIIYKMLWNKHKQ